MYDDRGTSWVDYWIDNTNYCAFFGCDDEGVCVGASRTVRGAVSEGCVGVVSTQSSRVPPVLPKPDYAALHDLFLDSLLHEQQELIAVRGCADDDIGSDPGLNLSATNNTESTPSWTLSSASSSDSLSESGASRKRRRGLLVTSPRRDPALTHPPVLSLPLVSSRGNLPPLNIANIKPPETYLHPSVRLQKDKGKGTDVGSEICSKGIPDCLDKLRQKMQLLTENCQPGTAASMKRRNAVVWEQHGNYEETRSLLTLRMGFLSMTYGILLRWDTGKTGLVTVVVLRKNCHDSFYKLLPSSTVNSCCPPPAVSPVSSLDEADGDLHLQPPFLVARPATFLPAEIAVSVLNATGLHKKSHWTVQLQLDDHTENILLAFDGSSMVPKLGGPLLYTLNRIYTSAVLEIRLLEHKVRRKTRLLRCSMVLPLHSLEAVSSDTTELPTTMRIPCPNGAIIEIEAMLVSDQAVWQRREVVARRKECIGRTRTSQTTRKRSPKKVVLVNDEEDVRSPWDWICVLC